MTDHNTPTPRTDNTDHWRVDRDEADLTYRDVVSADFARDLERELIDLQALHAAGAAPYDAEIERLQQSNAGLRDELAACRAALRELVECDDLWQAVHATGGFYHKRTDTVVEYYRRRLIAWAAARKLAGDGK